MSIGTKFNLVALGIPVAALLVLLGVVYFLAPNLFQPFLILVGGFLALEGVVWNRLRAQVETKMHNVWDNYLKEVRDRVGNTLVGGTYFFPDNGWGLEPKIAWVLKYGKYGPFRLYPTKLMRLKLVSKLMPAGEDFNSKLNAFSVNTRGIDLYYAFDHWGFRKVPPDQMERQGASTLATQKAIFDDLDKTKKQEVTELTQAWEKALGLAQQIVSILDKFSSENGIMPPSPSPYVPLARY